MDAFKVASAGLQGDYNLRPENQTASGVAVPMITFGS
jgi:hypothetical protein